MNVTNISISNPRPLYRYKTSLLTDIVQMNDQRYFACNKRWWLTFHHANKNTVVWPEAVKS